jgi:uncharacterized protein YxjI
MTEKDVKTKLENFRDTYIKSYNSPSTQMDLREHFYLVRDESKNIHELMALMYDDIHKVMTDNKNQILTLLDKAIQADTELYNYLLTIEKNNSKFNKPKKEWYAWTNLFKIPVLLGSIMALLLALYEIDSEAYNIIIDHIMTGIEKFKK